MIAITVTTIIIANSPGTFEASLCCVCVCVRVGHCVRVCGFFSLSQVHPFKGACNGPRRSIVVAMARRQSPK